MDRELTWSLLYTKPRAERWAEINLRKQGYATLLPLVKGRSGFGPLFPRYLFVGKGPLQRSEPLVSTRGVMYVVHFGDAPARVPLEIIDGIRARMDDHGVVAVDTSPDPDPLFAKQQRERLRAFEKLVRAGFRVKLA